MGDHPIPALLAILRDGGEVVMIQNDEFWFKLRVRTPAGVEHQVESVGSGTLARVAFENAVTRLYHWYFGDERYEADRTKEKPEERPMTQADAIRKLARNLAAVANPAVKFGPDAMKLLHEIGTAVFEDEGDKVVMDRTQGKLIQRLAAAEELIREWHYQITDLCQPPGVNTEKKIVRLQKIVYQMADYLMDRRRV